MKIFKYLLFTILLFNFNKTAAQDDLMKELEANKSGQKEIEIAAFKGVQICTMQSTKLAAKGEYYFLVSHRFGDLTNGLENFFGLDNAFTKIGGLYGITNWLTVGLSRQTYNKTFETSLKYKFANQEVNGFPVTITGYNTLDINTKLSTDFYPELKFNNRLGFSTQLPISRKFSNSFSLEINPIYIHKNLYDLIPNTEKKDNFLIGAGGRYKLTKRLSVNMEYAARLNAVKNAVYYNPISLGLDLETGGHVFQFVFSNNQAMNDVAYFTDARGQFGESGIFFGFNLYRVF